MPSKSHTVLWLGTPKTEFTCSTNELGMLPSNCTLSAAVVINVLNATSFLNEASHAIALFDVRHARGNYIVSANFLFLCACPIIPTSDFRMSSAFPFSYRMISHASADKLISWRSACLPSMFSSISNVDASTCPLLWLRASPVSFWIVSAARFVHYAYFVPSTVVLASPRYTAAIRYMYIEDAVFCIMLRHAVTAYIHPPPRMNQADVHDEVEMYWKNAQLDACVHASILIDLAHVSSSVNISGDARAYFLFSVCCSIGDGCVGWNMECRAL